MEGPRYSKNMLTIFTKNDMYKIYLVITILAWILHHVTSSTMLVIVVNNVFIYRMLGFRNNDELGDILITNSADSLCL